MLLSDQEIPVNEENIAHILSKENLSRFNGLDRLKAERMAIDKLIDLYENDHAQIGNFSISFDIETLVQNKLDKNNNVTKSL